MGIVDTKEVLDAVGVDDRVEDSKLKKMKPLPTGVGDGQRIKRANNWLNPISIDWTADMDGTDSGQMMGA